MTTSASQPRASRHAIVNATLVGGLCAGTLDISYAFIVYRFLGVDEVTILQSIASGILGRAAYAGGGATATLGLALHFLMTLLMALLFVLASRHEPRLRRWPVTSGILYGLIIYTVMNHIVVPLSAYPGPTGLPSPAMLAGGLAIHSLGVGLPIALAAQRFGRSGTHPARLGA